MNIWLFILIEENVSAKKGKIYLGKFVVGVHVAEHCQDEGSGFSCSWLWLGNQILWTKGQILKL